MSVATKTVRVQATVALVSRCARRTLQRAPRSEKTSVERVYFVILFGTGSKPGSKDGMNQMSTKSSAFLYSDEDYQCEL